MKILHLFFVLVAIQIVYFLFYTPNMNTDINGVFNLGNYGNISANASIYSSSANYTNNYTYVPGNTSSSFSGLPGDIGTSTSFWVSILNPLNGSTTPFFTWLCLLAVLVWGFGLFASRNEMVYLAPVFVIFLGVGLVPCVSLWNMITSDTGQFVCTVAPGSFCLLSSLAAFCLAGILYAMWLLSCLEWWSARSTA